MIDRCASAVIIRDMLPNTPSEEREAVLKHIRRAGAACLTDTQLRADAAKYGMDPKQALWFVTLLGQKVEELALGIEHLQHHHDPSNHRIYGP